MNPAEFARAYEGTFETGSGPMGIDPVKSPLPEMVRPIITAPSHSRACFEPEQFKLVVRWAAREARRLNADGLVGSGHSGLLLIGAVQYESGIPAYSVRRPGESTIAGGPSPRTVCGVARHGKLRRWLWLDDLVSNGTTLAYACRQLRRYEFTGPDQMYPLSALLYEAPVGLTQLRTDGYSYSALHELFHERGDTGMSIPVLTYPKPMNEENR